MGALYGGSTQALEVKTNEVGDNREKPGEGQLSSHHREASLSYDKALANSRKAFP